MKASHSLSPVFALLFCASIVSAQSFTVSQTGVFRPQNKKILLLKDSTSQKKIILFQTKLRVNTDGSPLSYHPQDPRGRDKAFNNICNAIVVKKDGSGANLCFTRFGDAISVFERFRDSNFQTVPAGFRITWQNVLATVKVNGKYVPCVFQSGDFKGFFGSLTALKNGLTSGLGECEINNQVNPMTVPALVLVGGANVVKDFGAKVGDLPSGDAIGSPKPFHSCPVGEFSATWFAAGRADAYYITVQLQHLIDMLRFEKPITVFFNNYSGFNNSRISNL